MCLLCLVFSLSCVDRRVVPVVWQVRFSPFMSPSAHAEVLIDHERKVLGGVWLHVNLETHLREVKFRGRRAATSHASGVVKSQTMRTCLGMPPTLPPPLRMFLCASRSNCLVLHLCSLCCGSLDFGQAWRRKRPRFSSVSGHPFYVCIGCLHAHRMLVWNLLDACLLLFFCLCAVLQTTTLWRACCLHVRCWSTLLASCSSRL